MVVPPGIPAVYTIRTSPLVAAVMESSPVIVLGVTSLLRLLGVIRYTPSDVTPGSLGMASPLRCKPS